MSVTGVVVVAVVLALVAAGYGLAAFAGRRSRHVSRRSSGRGRGLSCWPPRHRRRLR